MGGENGGYEGYARSAGRPRAPHDWRKTWSHLSQGRPSGGGGALLASLALAAALLPASALAQPPATQDGPLEAQAGLIASGTSGTCTWEIDENGKLTIRPENGISGTLEGTTGRAVWYDYSDAIKEAHVANGVKTDLFANGLFSYLINLETIDLGGLDTSETADMGGMFHGCISLKSIDLSSFDTSNAG